MNGRVLLVSIALAAGPALGCGYCVEDKIAAAYDHAVVAQALARGHDVAFIAYEVRVLRAKHDESTIKRAIERIAGIDHGSVRMSTASESLSVAFDPKRLPLRKLATALDRELAAFGIETTVLRFGNPATTPPGPR
jgi:copper chaperone CopZ